MSGDMRPDEASTQRGAIRVGFGGWDYEPWRQTFYPPTVPKT